ncbi:response regulator transcription factor [Reichenbachiella sp. MSK19-1]|uniref:response regulator transcription factor n=1 Tax=Reichenbachiella sp. MSK19-1 TaxID=1897631 RepID=UPI000E6B52C5|nr:response regulator transcription factor [Reichenbachiella sp. MSK19-1]RJE71943.1 two-component system response regulator [Reichenbachiella sp. MSK19-1]
MNKRILLVEDDQNLGFVIKDNLTIQGYQVDLCIDGDAGWLAYERGAYELCLFDIMLPKMDGLTLARKVRTVNPSVPIIFLTAKSLQEDKLAGFEIGADDYITKPFSIKELLYRVEVFMKRSQVIHDYQQQVEIGSYHFDPESFQLSLGKKMKKLTRREAEILHYLHQRVNTVVKRDELLIALWGDNDYFKGRSLDVFISKLRKYLSEEEHVDIENIHGVGFKLRIKKS